MSLNVTISQVILYAFGPFFCYPWKPIINTFGGSSYPTGYKHFWLQHQDPFNLLWHFICLIYQIIGNFSLLNLVDQYLFTASSDARWLSKITALGWILYLGTTQKCPAIARISSVISIGLAYHFVPLLSLTSVEYFVGISFFLIWIFQAVTRNRFSLNGDAPTILLLLIVKFSLSYFIPSQFLSQYQDHTPLIGFIYLLLISALSTRLDAVKTLIVGASLIGHILSLLTGEKLFYLHSIAFTAMLFQGLAHELSLETATLIKLMDESNHSAKVAYEWAHVTYFPNMLFHAFLDCSKIQQKKFEMRGK
jgi:hypothetical protein